MITTPAVVIGPGRVGRAISRFYQPPSQLCRRDECVPSTYKDSPIWVCTTNEGLEGVLPNISQHHRRNLIFIQNGMLLPWLLQHKLLHATQVLLYMSASDDGRVTDGQRTAVYGPWAEHVASILEANRVSCKVVHDQEHFNQLMLVKLLWSCIFWLLSAALGGKPVGVIAQDHRDDVRQLVLELLPIGQAYLRAQKEVHTGSSRAPETPETEAQSDVQDQSLSGAAQQKTGAGRSDSNGSNGAMHEIGANEGVDQLLTYSVAIADAVPSVHMARREFAWRNGFFLGIKHTPRHCEWLVKAGCQDLLLP